MPVETVKNLDDVEKLRQRVRNAAACTRGKLAELPDDPMEALHLLKLEEFGHHYLFDGRLNLIEQLNQSLYHNGVAGRSTPFVGSVSRLRWTAIEPWDKPRVGHSKYQAKSQAKSH